MIVYSIVKGVSIVISVAKGKYFSSVHAVLLAPLMLLAASC